MKVLIFPASSEIGLEIRRSMIGVREVTVFGADSLPDQHGSFVYENYELLPFVYEDSFIDKLKEMIKKHQIDAIFPAHDDVIVKMVNHAKEIGCRIVTSVAETATLCRSKSATYLALKKIVRVPEMYERGKEQFPVFLKPDASQGGKGTAIAQNQDELNFHPKKNPELLILEYLPGEEHTVDCFTDRTGELRFVGARIRERISNGISVSTRPATKEDQEKLQMMSLIVG